MQDSAQKTQSGRRWLYAAVGIIVMLFAGFVYAWSILSAPIHADFPDWSNAQLSLTFTLCMAFFCLGGFVAGNLAKKIGIRANVRISAVLFLAGFLLASRTQSLGMLYLSYGLLCGTASGFAYNAVMSVMTKWFPQNQGLISGVLLMGFGSSSMMIGSAFTALTPDTPGAWRGSFLFMGILMAVVLVVGSFFFRLPPAEALPAPKAKAVSAGAELSPTQMIRTPAFWCFFAWAILISGIGLAVIAQAKPIAAMVGEVNPAGISFAVGLISICNGLGRVLFGGLFDRLGWRPTMALVSGVSLLGVLLLLGAILLRSFPLVAVGFVVTGLAYGGAPTMGSAFIGSFFGQKNYPVNFSIGNMNLLVASFAGTAAGALYDASRSYVSTLVVLVGCCIAAFVVLCCIRRPK